MLEYTEIESNGGRFLEYDSKHDGHPLRHGNDHPGVPIFEHGWPIREQQLDECDRTGQSDGEESVRPGLMPHSKHSIRARLLTRQNMHIAQIFPVSKEHVRQLATAIVWFV